MNRAERLRSLGVLFTIIAVVIIFFGYSANDLSRVYGNNPLWSVLFGLLLLSIIVLTFFWGSVDEYYKDKKNKETVITAVTPIIIKEGNKERIYLYLTNLDKNECFELRWIYSKLELHCNSAT